MSQLKRITQEEEDDVHHVDIYADGSFKHDEATWAFAVIATMGDKETKFMGYAGGSLEAELLEAVEKPGSLQAEGAAAIHAIIWWLAERDNFSQRSITVHIDNKAVQGGAAGTNNINSENALLGALRGLALLSQQRDETSFIWIKGHDGHPWNELADVVAKQMRQGEQPGSFGQRPFAKIKDIRKLEWAWMFEQEKECLPRIDETGFWVTARAEETMKSRNEEKPRENKKEKEKEKPRRMKAKMKLGLCNVQTLGGREDRKTMGIGGLHEAGRTRFFQRQFEELQYSLVGICEARTEEGSKNTFGWRMLASGRTKDKANASELGVEF